MATAALYLAADIGGTRARFSLLDASSGQRTVRLDVDVADYPDIGDAIQAALSKLAPAGRVISAVLAVAGPVDEDDIELTNSGWRFSRSRLQAHFGWDDLVVLNDFEAAAYGVVALPANEHQRIGGPEQGDWSSPRVVLGPGTGFGVACVSPFATDWLVLRGEGGHARFAPASNEELDVVRVLIRERGGVEREDILSGAGLCNLHRALAAVRGVEVAAVGDPAVITAAAVGGDPFCANVLNVFCAILGSAAADIALEFGARDGVYIAGGIVPRFAPFFAASPFRTRFEQHHRFHHYLQAIPTLLVTRDDLGLAGAEFALLEALR